MSKHDALAVIGDPIAHSLSPVMQTAALRTAGLSWTYQAERVEPADLVRWVSAARHHLRGFNVTIPHKAAVVPLLDELAPTAQRLDAVNTVVVSEGRLTGHNTDMAGFNGALWALWGDHRFTRDGNTLRAVVFGAGGSARAVVTVLFDLGACVAVVSRNVARAQALIERTRIQAVGRDKSATAYTYDDHRLPAVLRECTMVVNTTPLGMDHLADRSPLADGDELPLNALVMDLVYGRPTPLLEYARGRGLRYADGLEMLVRQGAESFRLWTGITPDLAVMRAACHARVAEQCSAV